MYMNLKRTIMVLFLATGLFSGREVLAQRTYEEMESDGKRTGYNRNYSF